MGVIGYKNATCGEIRLVFVGEQRFSGDCYGNGRGTSKIKAGRKNRGRLKQSELQELSVCSLKVYERGATVLQVYEYCSDTQLMLLNICTCTFKM